MPLHKTINFKEYRAMDSELLRKIRDFWSFESKNCKCDPLRRVKFNDNAQIPLDLSCSKAA